MSDQPTAPPATASRGWVVRTIASSAAHPWLTLLLVAALAVWGGYAMLRSPLDAIPDLSDVQVIVFTEWPGQSPDLVEAQITYPISASLLAAPRVEYVRGQSMFGMSFIYAIFEDGTDIYWARSRILEYLSEVQGKLPTGVTPTLGPDATGVGWVYEYAIVDDSGKHSLQELRTLQDWTLRYALESVPGVAEVAAVGGFVKEYQVTLDPVRMQALGVTVPEVVEAIRESNEEVGGQVLELAEHEYMVRGRGYVRSIEDLAQVPLRTSAMGAPVYVANVGHVQLGPAPRRGFADLDGKGEAVGGIVVMRYGENALRVIEAVEKRLAEVAKSFPEGVRVVPVYDRSGLIEDSISTLPPHAHRGDGRRLDRHLPLPLARAQRAGADPHAAHRRAALVHPDALPGAHHQHHVARRHRGGDRGHGRRLDHPRREHAQEAGALGGRRPPR